MQKSIISWNENKLPVEDSFQSFLVEGARFTLNEEYPIIPKFMVSKKIPDSIMPFDKAITYRGDLSRTFICTFCKDSTFIRIKKNPIKYLHFFKRTAGIIGFDFSVHSDMPIIKQKSQMNDNLSLTYFYGKNGIPIIPNLRCGDDNLQKEFFMAIPENSIVAIGTHGFIKERYQKYEWLCFLEDVKKEINPKTVIVYGNLSGKVFDNIKSEMDFRFYTPWIYNGGKK